MELSGRRVLVLGGAGLVGTAVGRRILEHRPGRVVLASLRREEAEEAADALREEEGADGVEIAAAWGDLFVPEESKDRPRAEVLADPGARRRMVDDLYGELTEEVLARSSLGALLLSERPDVIVDCVNTAGALAYQDVFGSVARLREAGEAGSVDAEQVERHLSTLYLPQLIRHTQIALEAMRRAETRVYVKVGTAGTGGMGLNIPFTHSEERPSRVLLAKSGLAGAQTLLLYLMARTPGAPAVKEVKPTAAISWKRIGHGPVRRGGRVLRRIDAVPVALEEAFPPEPPTPPADPEAAERDAAEAQPGAGWSGRAARAGSGAGPDEPETSVGGAERETAPAKPWRELDEPLEGVWLDAGENGLFSPGEFETLTALGLMEFVTPEEIADTVVREILGHPSGRDVVAALDASTLGPTYRAGVLRSHALERMEALEREKGESVAYEMLGPPRLSKLLFEGTLLRRIHGTPAAAAAADPDETAARAQEILETDADLRQRILTVGLPVLLADGRRVLRGREVKAPPPVDGTVPDRRADRGWIDLRASNWTRWRSRLERYLEDVRSRPGPLEGSRVDFDLGAADDPIRPARLAAWIFRYEDDGERIKR